jgi:hypothetical protein
MPPDVPDSMMQQMPHYREKYDAAKKIHVYFIPGIDKQSSQKIYFYAIASELLHEQMMRCLKDGNIPDFAVVVQKGAGDPAPDIKAKIKAYYGFDHDEAA